MMTREETKRFQEALWQKDKEEKEALRLHSFVTLSLRARRLFRRALSTPESAEQDSLLRWAASHEEEAARQFFGCGLK